MSDMIPANLAPMPAHLQGMKTTNQTQLVANDGGPAAVPRISIRASRFRIVDSGVETVVDKAELPVVIVGSAGKSKVWYSEAYDPSAQAGPTCWSDDGNHPHPTVLDAPSKACATCPKNAWGSAASATSQHAKACADQRRIAVIPGDNPAGGVYQLTVPRSALKSFQTYCKELALRGVSVEQVVTNLYFDTAASYPKLMFRLNPENPWIGGEAVTIVENLLDGPDVKRALGIEDAPTVPDTPALTTHEQLNLALEAPAPVVEEAAAPNPFVSASPSLAAAAEAEATPAEVKTASAAEDIEALVAAMKRGAPDD